MEKKEKVESTVQNTLQGVQEDILKEEGFKVKIG